MLDTTHADSMIYVYKERITPLPTIPQRITPLPTHTHILLLLQAACKPLTQKPVTLLRVSVKAGTPPGTPGTPPGTPGTLPGTPGTPPGTRWNTAIDKTRIVKRIVRIVRIVDE
jgi:hypothetical protein